MTSRVRHRGSSHNRRPITHPTTPTPQQIMPSHVPAQSFNAIFQRFPMLSAPTKSSHSTHQCSEGAGRHESLGFQNLQILSDLLRTSLPSCLSLCPHRRFDNHVFTGGRTRHHHSFRNFFLKMVLPVELLFVVEPVWVPLLRAIKWLPNPCHDSVCFAVDSNPVLQQVVRHFCTCFRKSLRSRRSNHYA